MTALVQPLSAIVASVWAGAVCAISFMEAWLKFRAPGMTIPLGLGIGRLVFKGLNLMEWIFLIIILAEMLIKAGLSPADLPVSFIIPFFVLTLQSIWLLPALDARARQVIAGNQIPRSRLHYVYVASELVKVICLINLSLTLILSS